MITQARKVAMDNVALNDAPRSRAAPPPTGEPGRAERVRVIFVLGALIALGPLTIDMYLPALPSISEDLDASSSVVQLTLTGTLVGLGVGQLLVGPLSDALGRRRPLIGGAILHVLASVLCAIAPSIAVLGVLRALQGVGAAAAMVVALAVVRDLYTGNAAATALSRLMLVMGAAPILAPTLGSAILVAGSWRGIFAGLAALGVVLMLVAMFALKETLPPERRRAAGVLPVLRTYGSLLRDREFVVLALVAALGMSALFSYISGASFVLQEQYGLNQQEFAITFGIGAVAIIGAAQFNVPLLNRFTPRRIVVFALMAAVISGLVLTMLAATGTGGLLGFVIPLLFVLGSVGFVLPNAPALALSRHGEAAGAAAAMLGAAQFGLGALIAPLVGALGNDGPAMAITMTGGSAVALAALTTVVIRARRQPALAV
ncbi:DHA1 family bicyclomycin/chloramphenicol resistance-like MFS transporter [Amycolatopsis cihanbeyliensis]|uniref:DHA1 family bicyclomycin/chloramphenicol resistance-like MFS transporter n=1 Tax=Amycolatopsis cihanbeyliensis TaxID=1128664 RepID=A0A542DJJ9_AMYCI|nr:DHA1 family bicyclomycin/chloramphenicol resistance-like MFS transporter [Amycolatopsis cihanbeyliensis]